MTDFVMVDGSLIGLFYDETILAHQMPQASAVHHIIVIPVTEIPTGDFAGELTSSHRAAILGSLKSGDGLSRGTNCMANIPPITFREKLRQKIDKASSEILEKETTFKGRIGYVFREAFLMSVLLFSKTLRKLIPFFLITFLPTVFMVLLACQFFLWPSVVSKIFGLVIIMLIVIAIWPRTEFETKSSPSAILTTHIRSLTWGDFLNPMFIFNALLTSLRKLRIGSILPTADTMIFHAAFTAPCYVFLFLYYAVSGLNDYYDWPGQTFVGVWNFIAADPIIYLWKVTKEASTSFSKLGPLTDV